MRAISEQRADRDRFIALSFAAADVVMELDQDHRIGFAAGAQRAIFGAADGELLGRPLADLVARQDRGRLLGALAATPRGHRMVPVSVRTVCNGAPPVVVAGYRLDHEHTRYYVALSVERRPLTRAPAEGADRDPETGLLAADAFGEHVGTRIEAARAQGAEVELTLLDLRELEDLRGRVAEETADEVVGYVADALRASSFDGDSAGRFESDTFGVLHDANLDITNLRLQIEEITRRVDPAGEGVRARTAQVEVDAQALTSTADAARAVLYTIRKFTEAEGDHFTIATLSEGCEAMARDTVNQIAAFKNIIGERRFDVALQPIVDLGSRRVHHYEALARFREEGHRESPFSLITFAEEVGVIGDFDLAMAERAIMLLDDASKHGAPFSVAVNLSGQSLSSPAFVESLMALLRAHPEARQRLLFEITESAQLNDLEAANRLIQTLRRAGHAVCLDDFGAGASAFQYLRALQVDVVKIDGVYVREALTTTTGKPFMKAMVGLCRDLGVEVVAEMVEDEKTCAFLRGCGVKFGQGYLFGRPAPAQAAEATMRTQLIIPPRAKAAARR